MSLMPVLANSGVFARFMHRGNEEKATNVVENRVALRSVRVTVPLVCDRRSLRHKPPGQRSHQCVNCHPQTRLGICLPNERAHQ